MDSSFSKTLMKIRAQAGALDADLIQVSVAEERYLAAAVNTVNAMSDGQLQAALEELDKNGQGEP